jgi:hypothetical protein
VDQREVRIVLLPGRRTSWKRAERWIEQASDEWLEQMESESDGIYMLQDYGALQDLLNANKIEAHDRLWEKQLREILRDDLRRLRQLLDGERDCNFVSHRDGGWLCAGPKAVYSKEDALTPFYRA